MTKLCDMTPDEQVALMERAREALEAVFSEDTEFMVLAWPRGDEDTVYPLALARTGGAQRAVVITLLMKTIAGVAEMTYDEVRPGLDKEHADKMRWLITEFINVITPIEGRHRRVVAIEDAKTDTQMVVSSLDLPGLRRFFDDVIREMAKAN